MKPYDTYTDEVNVVVETDYFYVQLFDGRDYPYALVLELTDLGKEQEVLVVPNYVEGLPVTDIGRSVWGVLKWKLVSENLKKLYVNTNMQSIKQETLMECWNFEELVVLSVPDTYGVSGHESVKKVISSVHLMEDQLLVYVRDL